MDKHKNFYDDIVSTLQQKVDKVIKKNFKWDNECPPIFTVSVLSDDMESQSIILTISHGHVAFSETLFPRKEAMYGYEYIGEIIEKMFNRTM